MIQLVPMAVHDQGGAKLLVAVRYNLDIDGA